MTDNQIPTLLFKFLEGTISAAEQVQLDEWRGADPSNQEFFDELNNEDSLSKAISEFHPDNYQTTKQRIWSKVKDKIPAVPKSKVINLKMWWAAAAIIIMLGAGAYFAFFNKVNKQDEIVKLPAKDIEAPKITKATITLADGRIISIDSLSTIEQASIKVTKTKDGQIVYAGLGNEVVFNTLSNPRGSKVIDLVLNDGSHVWLNAGSSLTYPVAFIGKDRKVSITGEAYFEITKDSRPFSVSKGNMQVQVLGTKFNVNAYDDESDIKVTLLEGSVQITAPNSFASYAVKIKPGQQAIVSKTNVEVNNAVDVDAVMAWRNGLFQFNRASVQEVMRQISRWYDVEVAYEGKIPQRSFGGKINRTTSLSQALKILKESNIHFKVEGRKITVLP